ncbi:MAG: hypothetical protein FWG29_03615 [Treponema sp.]|nr:hypothetical protein [Treponema sp.]
MIMFIIMASRSILTGIFILFFVFSCSNRKVIRDSAVSDVQFDLPPRQDMPALRILDYKNRNEGANLAVWLRRYLDNGITGTESLLPYQESYLFIASIRSARLPVITQWLANYYPDRDFNRLAAQRVQKRFEQDLTDKPPDMVYGPNYEKAIKAAYGNTFWGAVKIDDSWVLAIPAVQEEFPEPEQSRYWGFILVSIPRETLEIQVHELLSKISNSKTKEGRPATKEQNAAFDLIKEHFFEQF